MAERIKTMGQKKRICKPMNYRERLKDQSWYHSPQWRKLRAAQLSKQPLCCMCYAEGIVREAKHVDHIIDRKDDMSRALDPTNLQSLCVSCHSKKTKQTKKDKDNDRV